MFIRASPLKKCEMRKTSRLLRILFALVLISMVNVAQILPIIIEASDGEAIKGLKELLAYVPSMKCSFTTSSSGAFSFEYSIVAEETVEGNACWKVEATFGDSHSTNEYVIWISKSTGTAVQVSIGEDTYTGDLATTIGGAFLGAFNLFYSFWAAWDYETFYPYWQEHEAYGTFTFLGAEQRSYGPTTLTVYKWKYSGTTTAPQSYQWAVEGWTSPSQTGGMLTYLYVESLDKKTWWKWELVSIEFSEAPKPPNVSTGSTRSSGTNVNPGESFTVSIDYSNPEASFAIHNAELKVDGKVIDSKFVTVFPGKNETVTFAVTISTEGTHIVEIDGKTIPITVSATPSAVFVLSNLKIDPSSVEVKKTVTISAKVENTGTKTAAFTAVLSINGRKVDEETVTLNGGESTTITFTTSNDQPGTYSVSLGDLSGTYTVSEVFPILLVGAGAVVVIAIAVVLFLVMRKPKQEVAQPPPPPPPSC